MRDAYGFGRRLSPIDIRDYKLAAYMPADLGDLSGGKFWPFDAEPLDQKDEPECVGFAMANYGINAPIQDHYTNADGRAFYRMCKEIDGDDLPGSTVRTAARVLKNVLMRISKFAFANSVDEISYWLLHNGPLIVGTEWTQGMLAPDEYNIIHPTGITLGGHCYLLNEKTVSGHYRIQNSWDARWGQDGQAYISISDFADLFMDSGEAMTAVELPYPVTAKSSGCVDAFLKLFHFEQPAIAG